MVYIQPDETVLNILARYPEAAAVFIQFHVDCIGCSMSSFCTLADVAGDYKLDLAELARAIQITIADLGA